MRDLIIISYQFLSIASNIAAIYFGWQRNFEMMVLFLILGSVSNILSKILNSHEA